MSKDRSARPPRQRREIAALATCPDAAGHGTRRSVHPPMPCKRGARIARHLSPHAARRAAAERLVAAGARPRLELRVHDVGRTVIRTSEPRLRVHLEADPLRTQLL